MNIASRIEGAAEPNGIAVSTPTFNRCIESFEFEPPEFLTLKGVGATQIHRLKIEASGEPIRLTISD